MSSSEARTLVQRALANPSRAFARWLAESLERVAARLAEPRDDTGSPVPALLSALVRRAARAARLEADLGAGAGRGDAPGEAGEDGDALDRRLRAIVDPDSARDALASIQELQRGVIEAAFTRLDVPADAARRIGGAFEALGDGQRRLLDHWFATESLREAELLAHVFHDLKSPLTSVLFLSDALFSGQSGALTEPQRRQVQLIYTASLSLLTLVENVLSSRNLEAGEITPEHVPFSVFALAEEIERITMPLASHKRLTLEIFRDCRSARSGDPDALRRVLLNLLTNAIAYTDRGRVAVHFQEAGRDLVVLVEDTGPGIDDQELADLFTPFRAHSAAHGARRFSGAGLGLSICHRLTRIMEGDIWVDTELGAGSRFGVRVPFPPVE